MTKVSYTFENLVVHVIIPSFYLHIVKCDGGLSRKLFHLLR